MPNPRGVPGDLYAEALRLFRARTPVVAAVQGAAVGGGAMVLTIGGGSLWGRAPHDEYVNDNFVGTVEKVTAEAVKEHFGEMVKGWIDRKKQLS